MKQEKEKYEFVYVEKDGTIRELDKDEIEYLQTEFEPTDGARPYIKSKYTQLTPDKKISGFLHRDEVPKEIRIINTHLRYAEIGFPIGIHKSNKVIELSTGVYSIKILGGWGVSIGDFSIELKNKKNDTVITPKIAIWRFPSYEFGERAKKIMNLTIPETGTYFIKFKKQKDLKVKRSSLFIKQLFQKEIPNQQLKICIE